MADPWAVQPHEHAKFAEHFRNLGPVGGMLTGEQAKRFMLQSQLPPPVLGQIWFLADTNLDGKLDLREFSIACKIINLKLHGHEIPKTLPPSLLSSLSPTGGVPRPVQGFAHSQPKPPIPPMPSIPPAPIVSPMSQPILSGVPSLPPMSQPILAGVQSVPPMSQPIPAGVPSVPPMSRPFIPGVPNAPAMSQPILSGVQSIPPMSQPILPGLPSQPILAGVPSVPPMSQPLTAQSLLGDFGDQPLMPTQPMSAQVPDLIRPTEMPGSVQVLPTAAQPLVASPPLTHGLASPPKPDPMGLVGQVVTSTPIVMQKSEENVSGVTSPQLDSPLGMVSPPPALEWAIPQPQKLKYTQLFNATDRAKSGAVSGAQARSIMLQSRLPQAALAQIWALADLDNDGKLGCEEFVLAMYLCEKATQGEAVPVKLPPELVPPTFRNLRRESVSSNHSASSYEERRREHMARGQQELERRRSALQDAMMKEKDAEAERERKERDELEKKEKIRVEALKREQEELQRKQKEEQEKREAARKEMERQCQLEWEKKRTRELEALRSEEQSKVFKLKSRSQAVSAELGTAATRAGNLAKEIRETRTAVAAAKCTIDGMRSDRDSSMSEMHQLKARVKELNAKQIALNKEKAELDAKAKASEGAGDDGKLSMMEVTLKQLRDKVDAARAIVEAKSTDLDANKSQLSELTAHVTELGDKCERVWQLYEERRQEYLERKSTAPAEAAWGAAEADWGTSNEAWGDTGATEEPWTDADASTVSEAVVPPAAAVVVSGTPRWRCVYEFTARNGDELSLQPGDWVSEATAPRGSAEPGWCWGCARGREGWFPSSYVEEPAAGDMLMSVGPMEAIDNKTPLEGIAEVPEAEMANDLGGAMPTVEGGDFYVASYPYSSAEPGDLNFEAGERIEVTRRDGDWWTGRVGNRTGIFPSNYVSKDPLEPPAPAAAASAPAAVPAAPEPSPAPPQPMSPPQPMETASEPEAPVVQQQEQKSSTPISSEVAAITDAAAAAAGTRPASAARRDSGRDSVTGGRRKPEVAQAIANYTATSSEQLSLTKGQLLVVRKKADSGWWEGELQAKGRNRALGWFPATYVKLLQPSGRTSGRTTPVMSKSDPMPSETVIDKVMALYPYTAMNADELSFEKDDIIAVTDRSQDPAWWQGELRGMTGLFPSNYVSKLVN